MKKIIILLILIIAVITFVYQGKKDADFPISPPQVSTSTVLKKYINEEYGFEFEYPSDMKIEIISYDKTTSAGIMIRKITDNVSSGIIISLPVNSDFAMKPNYKSISDFKTNYITTHYQSSLINPELKNYAEVRILEQQEYQLNGYNLLRQIYDYGYPQTDGSLNTTEESNEKNSIRYIVSNNSKLFILKIINYVQNDIELEKQLQLIVSSFKIKK